MLPVLSGYEVIRQLRSSHVWTPILVISAKDGENDEADGLDLGADDYLTKPVSFVVLLAHLRALLRRGGRHALGPRQPATSCSTRTLIRDQSRRERPADHERVRHAGVPDQAPGQTVSKAELLEHVWDNPGTDPNAVEVYAGYLRRKLGRDAVQTVRGIGYCLRPT